MSTICKSSAKQFLIALEDGTTEKVEGELVTIMGHKCFVWTKPSKVLEDTTVWCISELKSGMNAGSGYSRHVADLLARELFISTSHLEMDKSNRGKFRHYGILTYPLN